MRVIVDSAESISTPDGHTVSVKTIGAIRVQHQRSDLAPDQALKIIESIRDRGRIDLRFWKPL